VLTCQGVEENSQTSTRFHTNTEDRLVPTSWWIRRIAIFGILAEQSMCNIKHRPVGIIGTNTDIP